MANRLNEALERFLVAAATSFKVGKAEARTGEGPRLLITDAKLLRKLVKTLEQRPEFLDLVRVTGEELLCDKVEDAQYSPSGEVRLYLRLSGLYQRVFAAETPVPATTLLADYGDSFTRPADKVTHLAPLQFVSFASELLACGGFEVRKFAAHDLDRIFRNDVRRVFFPRMQVDTERLAQYWFVCTTEDRPVTRKGYVSIAVASETQGATDRFPAGIQRALRYLPLYDWNKETEAEEGRLGYQIILRDRLILARPRIPFNVSVSDSLIGWPVACPDVEEALGERGGVAQYEWLRTCQYPFQYGADETARFAAFMRAISELMGRIDTVGQSWAFAGKAIEFLWRGFSSETSEQLLWNITAIEAALGERVSSGLTNLLRNRISAVFGGTSSNRRDTRKRFEELYDLRSGYIHGNAEAGPRSLAVEDLLQARTFARVVVLWVLRYLDHIHRRLGAEDVPTREALLQVLDMDSARRRDIGRTLSALPDSFPTVAEWNC
jgi:hypothetical protein